MNLRMYTHTYTHVQSCTHTYMHVAMGQTRHDSDLGLCWQTGDNAFVFAKGGWCGLRFLF